MLMLSMFFDERFSQEFPSKDVLEELEVVDSVPKHANLMLPGAARYGKPSPPVSCTLLHHVHEARG